MNISDSAYTIKTGDRIAQLVVLPIEAAEFVIVDELPETSRGNRAFGSSGK